MRIARYIDYMSLQIVLHVLLINELLVQSMLIESTESGGVFKEIVSLYSTSKLRRVALVCHFAYFACSFSYHVTSNLVHRIVFAYIFLIPIAIRISGHIVINADNLSTDIAVFAMASAGVDTLAICVNLTLTRHLGRRWSCMIAFVMAGLCMLALLVLDCTIGYIYFIIGLNSPYIYMMCDVHYNFRPIQLGADDRIDRPAGHLIGF